MKLRTKALKHACREAAQEALKALVDREPRKLEDDGSRHPAGHYAYIGNTRLPDTWDGLLRDAAGNLDRELIAKAYETFGPMFASGEQRSREGELLDAARVRVEEAAKAAGLDVSQLKESRSATFLDHLQAAARRPVWL